MSRLSFLEYFCQLVKLVSQRSTCIRRKVGAIAVRDNQILATGYNGPPHGLAHCDTVGCLRAKLNIPSGQHHEICRGVHAEQNVIIQASLHGISLEGADLYVTNYPCVQCSKMLINARIKAVYYLAPYFDELAQDMFEEANIPVENIILN